MQQQGIFSFGQLLKLAVDILGMLVLIKVEFESFNEDSDERIFSELIAFFRLNVRRLPCSVGLEVAVFLFGLFSLGNRLHVSRKIKTNFQLVLEQNVSVWWSDFKGPPLRAASENAFTQLIKFVLQLQLFIRTGAVEVFEVLPGGE